MSAKALERKQRRTEKFKNGEVKRSKRNDIVEEPNIPEKIPSTKKETTTSTNRTKLVNAATQTDWDKDVINKRDEITKKVIKEDLLLSKKAFIEKMNKIYDANHKIFIPGISSISDAKNSVDPLFTEASSTHHGNDPAAMCSKSLMISADDSRMSVDDKDEEDMLQSDCE